MTRTNLDDLEAEIASILSEARERGIDCPAICKTHQFAALIDCPISTVGGWFGGGSLPRDSWRKRGRQRMIRRDAALRAYLSDPDWSSR